MSRPDQVQSLSGAELRDLFTTATAWLERNVPQVNAVNVFPVPDGDTGTNMFATMRAVSAAAQQCQETSAGAMLAAMSRAALWEGRGNSGVILSQIIRGLARSAEGLEAMGAKDLANAFEQASASAYKAVEPVEGTILTVIREVSEAVRAAVSNGNVEIVSLFETAVEASKESVVRTPTLLPKLAEAGVVDAGGLGLSVILDGMLRHLKGEPLEAVAVTTGTVEGEWLAATGARHEMEDSLYGYCTELLVGGEGLDVDSMRRRISELGESVIVVGDPQLVRVHVHTNDPGAALSVGTGAGQLVQVKVDNIRKQAERFVEMHEQLRGEDGEAPALSTVGVVAGEGMARVFLGEGCTRIVSGGPTMNPSAREIAEAIESCPSVDVAVLPNDKNIILAARQARELTEKRVHVIGSKSMPQGIAALLKVNAEDDVTSLVEAMEQACGTIRTIEVTRAVSTRSVGGVRVNEGDVIAIVDDDLKLGAPSPEDAVLRALEGLPEPGSLVTIYHGAGTTAQRAQDLADNLRQRFAGVEVQVVDGGQPHYDYIVSAE